MNTYINKVLGEVNKLTNKIHSTLFFGENINTGSSIGGLARGLQVGDASHILNVGNCELTHCGVGFGILLDGGNSVLYVKQLDFMLLGLDQICNTYNFIRAFVPPEKWGSFTIFAIVCDQGYQGPQSSFNGSGDISSIANIPIYCLNSNAEIESIVSDKFVKPGFRIICLSQKQFSASALEKEVLIKTNDLSIFKYSEGTAGTIVSYNFALRKALEVGELLGKFGISVDIFHLNYIPSMNIEMIIESCRRTGKLVVIDDSKSITKYSDSLLAKLCMNSIQVKVIEINRRALSDVDYGACADELIINFDNLKDFLSA
jgi:pyruvate dehydrogenase E1 component beta subunit